MHDVYIDRRLVDIEKDKRLVPPKKKTARQSHARTVEQKEGFHSSQEQFGTEMRYLQTLLKQNHWRPFRLW